MLVVVAHAGLQRLVPGGAGVTIFFSISGFVITYLLLRERQRAGGFAVRSFYLRRVLKIGPPLIVIVVVPSFVYAAVTHRLDWDALISQVFFYYNWYGIAGGQGQLPGTGVVWSLSIEEQFYIAFAIFWLVAHRSRYYFQLVVSLGVIAVVVSEVARFWLALTVGDESNRIYHGTDTRMGGIALGVLTAALFVHLSRAENGRRACVGSR